MEFLFRHVALYSAAPKFGIEKPIGCKVRHNMTWICKQLHWIFQCLNFGAPDNECLLWDATYQESHRLAMTFARWFFRRSGNGIPRGNVRQLNCYDVHVIVEGVLDSFNRNWLIRFTTIIHANITNLLLLRKLRNIIRTFSIYIRPYRHYSNNFIMLMQLRQLITIKT